MGWVGREEDEAEGAGASATVRWELAFAVASWPLKVSEPVTKLCVVENPKLSPINDHNQENNAGSTSSCSVAGE
ncbi:unnamed protein product [Zymoseptoria tritici ST99CH_3D7]|uniref:Uncharacterized protein n=1 Tax=Zymoseptoria tritici (strain ST99CH_3D7) TaxID=1276538 RepID=A0A1X7S3X4_ZYMT9|nr:unnamed protein product [Zymoseptoria tritici ST99CH_3D7]